MTKIQHDLDNQVQKIHDERDEKLKTKDNLAQE
jgi:hypothetical protein